MTTTAKIAAYNSGELVLIPDTSIKRELLQKQVKSVEIHLSKHGKTQAHILAANFPLDFRLFSVKYVSIRPQKGENQRKICSPICTPEFFRVYLNDGRTISAAQRKKIFAIIRDVSLWNGHDPEYLRELFTWDFRSIDGRDNFSLSTVDKTTAREFLDYLIQFCMKNSIPTKKPLIAHAEDVGRYLYHCLEHKKCAICNASAEVHHVSRVGMGRDRSKICHVGLQAIALCREHHIMAHANEKQLFEKYKIFGIKLDEYLVGILNLGGGT